MIAVNNEGPGTYPVFWDGGNTTVIVAAYAGTGNITMNFINETGAVIRAEAFSGLSTAVTPIELPPGDYEFVIPGTVTAATITMNRVP
jgi:hypothetical protein